MDAQLHVDTKSWRGVGVYCSPMKMRAPLFSMLLASVLLSCAEDESSPGGPGYLRLSITDPAATEIGTIPFVFDETELGSCHMIAANKDMEIDTVEVSFWRGGKNTRSAVFENAILYFPSSESDEEHSVSADFSVSMQARNEKESFRTLDSWNRGQDRQLCVVKYERTSTNFRGSIDCPVQERLTAARLKVSGKFSCPIQKETGELQ